MPLPANALISIDTARAWIPGLSAMADPDLERMIGGASATADRLTGRALAAQDHVVTIHGSGRRELKVPHYPVQTITDVRIDAGGVFGPETVVIDYDADLPTGFLYRRSGWPDGWRNVRVDMRAGYEIDGAPEDLQAAVAEVIEWMSRRVQEQAIGIRTITSPDGINTAFDLDVPMAARNVFKAYREVYL